MSNEQSQQPPENKPFFKKQWSEYTPAQKVVAPFFGIIIFAAAFYVGQSIFG